MALIALRLKYECCANASFYQAQNAFCAEITRKLWIGIVRFFDLLFYCLLPLLYEHMFLVYCSNKTSAETINAIYIKLTNKFKYIKLELKLERKRNIKRNEFFFWRFECSIRRRILVRCDLFYFSTMNVEWLEIATQSWSENKFANHYFDFNF